MRGGSLSSRHPRPSGLRVVRSSLLSAGGLVRRQEDDGSREGTEVTERRPR